MKISARQGKGGCPASSGQALAEFLVLAVALLPLFLLLPLIAKYQDIAYQTLVASRYVAFDAMTRNDGQSSWKPPEQLAAEVRRRLAGAADAPSRPGMWPATTSPIRIFFGAPLTAAP
ncbi:hypothetical protein ACLB1G_04040 [Oxalobacteraceae bacterium A2-2]